MSYNGRERRAVIKKSKKAEPVGFISRLFRRKVKEKPLNAAEWYEQGFSIMHTTSDYEEAIQALTASIELDSTNAKTYLNRGMAYELINNMQQAIVDYSKVIKLLPKDAKAYYLDHDWTYQNLKA